MKIQKLESGDFWKNKKLRNENWVSAETSDVRAINCHGDGKTHKEEFQIAWKTEVTFQRVSAYLLQIRTICQESHVKSLFMQITSLQVVSFSSGGVPWGQTSPHTVRAMAPWGGTCILPDKLPGTLSCRFPNSRALDLPFCLHPLEPPPIYGKGDLERRAISPSDDTMLCECVGYGPGWLCFSEARGEELSTWHGGFCGNREAGRAPKGVGLGERDVPPKGWAITGVQGIACLA